MNSIDLIGQTLDEKYQIERELGRGGMGTVYLATHLGTQRPVAVKIIEPRFMRRTEFVERFRREARAAGRLRHPNVVDVTDFGFAQTRQGQLAYLVMEYLDGCTLGEILDEENNLPVSWTLDILDQVCSAVHEAHLQGVIHRDLKPDNIWLEPNQRGGYTVKVLDFGIAKLEEPRAGDSEEGSRWQVASPAAVDAQTPTIADDSPETDVPDGGWQNSTPKLIDTGASKAVSASSDDLQSIERTPDLTRAGAVLGTPLYMSPEQFRGEKLDARSDVYSLAVIAYRMLSGATPFSGDFTSVMEGHTKHPPPPLAPKKGRSKLRRVIASALAKDPDARPQTAEAFASALRAHSEGIFGLLRRGVMIYTHYMPKFLGLALLLYLPVMIATLLNVGGTIFYFEPDSGPIGIAIRVGGALLSTFTGFFCAYLILGGTTWLVMQILAMPLRPVRLRPALHAIRKNWKRLIGTGLLSTLLTGLGYVLCFIPGLILSVLLALVAPVVMMENARGLAAMRRSKSLTMRSLRTTVAAVAILFFVPVLVAGATSLFVTSSVKAFTNEPQDPQAAGRPPVAMNDGSEPDLRGRFWSMTSESLTALCLLPIQVLLTSLSSVVVALLYLKTRQSGGESLQDLLSEFEETDQPRKKWQERARQRLIQSRRVTSNYRLGNSLTSRSSSGSLPEHLEYL